MEPRLAFTACQNPHRQKFPKPPSLTRSHPRKFGAAGGRRSSDCGLRSSSGLRTSASGPRSSLLRADDLTSGNRRAPGVHRAGGDVRFARPKDRLLRAQTDADQGRWLVGLSAVFFSIVVHCLAVPLFQPSSSSFEVRSSCIRIRYGCPSRRAPMAPR
jgi:hypothetical protein